MVAGEREGRGGGGEEEGEGEEEEDDDEEEGKEEEEEEEEGGLTAEQWREDDSRHSRACLHRDLYRPRARRLKPETSSVSRVSETTRFSEPCTSTTARSLHASTDTARLPQAEEICVRDRFINHKQATETQKRRHKQKQAHTRIL